MSLTLNEIEATGKRAARGAGLDWGIAEEAGKAARWLAAHGLPGPELLSDLLTRNDGQHYNDIAPISVDGPWSAPSGLLCPLIAGAVLADRAAALTSGRSFELGGTSFPLLLAPYAKDCVLKSGTAVEIVWPDVVLKVSPASRLKIEGNENDVVVTKAPYVRCHIVTDDAAGGGAIAPRRRAVDAVAWDRLNEFALRTYAPATEESRTLGAGADRIDSE